MTYINSEGFLSTKGEFGTDDDERTRRREAEEKYAFEVVCGHCGAARLNTDPEDCCEYSGSTQSYRGSDAARWHRNVGDH